MDISVVISKSEYKNVLLKYVINKYFNPLRLIILYVIFLLISMQIGTNNSHKLLFLLIVYPIFGLLFYLFYYSLRFWIPLIKFNKIIDVMDSKASYSIQINNDILRFITLKGERKVTMRQVISIKEYNDFLIISLLDNSIYIVPINLFDDNTPIKDFVKLIQDGIIKIRGTLNIPLFLRPPYLLGVFCFIPIVGIFVGFVLIMLGIFQYKDRLMIIIGSLGIVFTIVLYSVLFPGLWDKKENEKQFAIVSQMQVNELIKEIEFYKLQKGKYPDNLEQLQKSKSMVMIFDPLQSGKDNSSKYNYDLVGDRYKLFSSGIDKIPNTKDDIYPEIDDSTKVGFIK